MKLGTTGKGEILLTEVYSGVLLETDDKETIGICMRDTGFEFNYNGVWYEAKQGILREMKKEEPKQETLEEAKYNAYKEYWNENHTQEVKSNFLTAFELGAKWKQERMYSEEEVLIIITELKSFLSFGDEFNEIEWFKKIKKK